MTRPLHLCQAANRNLASLADGSARISRERYALALKDRDARDREYRAAERARLRDLRAEYRAITKLCDQYDRKLQRGTITPDERAAYEEADHYRWQLAASLR